MGWVLFVDVIGGAAGDMLLAALLDAGAPIDAVLAAVDAVVPGRFDIGLEEVRRGGLRAAHLTIRRGDGSPAADLPARPFHQLADAIAGANLPDGVRARASNVVRRLGEAEGRVHGLSIEDLHLHELGDDDTLLDVVGIAAALEALDATDVLVSPIPLGTSPPRGGTHAHGPMPMPATVTLELLRGFPVRGGWAGETVTPTAAAVLAALARPAESFPAMTVERVGYGAGTDDPQDVANVVRVVLGRAGDPGESGGRIGSAGREIVLVEANLDDLAPELVADAVRALGAAGAIDVWTTAAGMKKGRPGVVLSALCEPAAAERLTRAFFEHTSTFGVRATTLRRAELERRVVVVSLPEGEVRVKVGLLDGRAVSATPEHDDVAAVAERLGRPVRHVYEEAVAAARSLRFAGAIEEASP